MSECNDEVNCTCRHCEEIRQAVLREVRDAIQEMAWEYDEDGQVMGWDNPDLAYEVEALFRKGGRFEAEEGNDG